MKSKLFFPNCKIVLNFTICPTVTDISPYVSNQADSLNCTSICGVLSYPLTRLLTELDLRADQYSLLATFIPAVAVTLA